MSDTAIETQAAPPLPVDLPLEALADFCRRWQITKMLLFGSALRDDFGPDSDYDFLVEFAPEARVTFMTLGQMERELEALLGRRIDLGTKLKPLIRDEVLASARVLYAE